jgi:hypothetical protein
VTSGILAVTTAEKFTEGGFLTLLITGAVIGFCILNRAHYQKIRRKLGKADESLPIEYPRPAPQPVLEPNEPTAGLRGRLVPVGRGVCAGLGAARIPETLPQFCFHERASVDAKCYSRSDELEQERRKAEATLSYFITYCNNRDLAAKTYIRY